MQYDERRVLLKIRTKKKICYSSRMPETMACQKLDIWRYTSAKFIFFVRQSAFHYRISIFCNVSYSCLGILTRYPAELNITWSTIGKDPITNERFSRRMTGVDILSRLKRNCSLKVFEKLHAGLKTKYLSKRSSLIYKMDIFDDYTFPQPFPPDKFLRLPNGLPDQAYLMLGTKATGKMCLIIILQIPLIIWNPLWTCN